MAGHATLGLDRLVLKDKRPLFVCVAGVADLISRSGRAQLLANEPAMGIVAVCALDQPFFNAMVEWHVELRFDLLMAAVTKRGLRFGQKKLISRAVMGRMAADAAQVVFTMRRAGEVHVISARVMAF